MQLYLESDTVELISNHFRRPMRLTTSELCALELGLAILATQSAPDERSAIDRARQRLRQIITRVGSDESVAGLRHVSLGADGYAAQIGTVRAALRSRRKLRITYRKGDAEDPTVCTVCPYALVAAHGRVLHLTGSGTMTVRHSPRIARWIAEREDVPPDQDGSLTMDHPLADPDWGVRHVLQYGPDAEVIAPPELRDAVVQRLQRMLGGSASGTTLV